MTSRGANSFWKEIEGNFTFIPPKGDFVRFLLYLCGCITKLLMFFPKIVSLQYLC